MSNLGVCRSCGAPLLWAVSGIERVALDREPTPEGSMQIKRGPVGERPQVFVARYLEDVGQREGIDPERYRRHSCPEAERREEVA